MCLSASLLDRFVRESDATLNVVVLTLYPSNEGYTLALKIQDALENETAMIPYREDELLKCVDSQQLPPVLVELLEQIGAHCVFYDGCVFLEVRDFRQSSKTGPWHVLLKPTLQVSRSVCRSLWSAALVTLLRLCVSCRTLWPTRAPCARRTVGVWTRCCTSRACCAWLWPSRCA